MSVKNSYKRCKSNLEQVCFLEQVFKFLRDDAFLISASNLFHKVEAATLNAHSTYDDLSQDTGTCNSIWLGDLSFLDDFLMDTSSYSEYQYQNCQRQYYPTWIDPYLYIDGPLILDNLTDLEENTKLWV